MASEPTTPRIAVPSIGDMLFAAALLVVAILSGVFIDAGRPDTIQPDRWWQWILIVTPSLAVAFRRVNPIAATIVATTAQVLIWTNDLPEFLLAIVVILYTAAADGRPAALRTSIASAVVLTAITVVGLQIAPDVSAYQVPLVLLTCATAIALGVNSARQRHRASALAVEVTETRLHAEHVRETAITEERAAIARELHDIIGHTLATIAVQAEAADRVAANQPAAAANALAAIASTSRNSLDETRRVLAGLRVTNDAALSPAPDAASLRALVTNLGNAGAEVSLTETGLDENPPSEVVLSGAYRIVQEALTNAVKHGGPDATIDVNLACCRSMLTIAVVNTITGAGVDDLEPGNGINGMAERASILGGTFDTTQTESTFTVVATLPTRS